MPTPRLPKEAAEKAISAVNDALLQGHLPVGVAPRGGRIGALAAAAAAVGISRKTFRNQVERAKELYGIEPDWSLYKEPERHGEAVQDGYKLKGTSTLYDADGNVIIEWVKTEADKKRLDALAREMLKEMAADLPALPKRKPPTDFNENLMSVIPFGDPHFGLYCWAEEVGDDFDLATAKRDLCAAVDYLVSQSPSSKRCVIANLGDFFHADNIEGKTAKSGNILDMDTRLPKVIRVGVSAVRQCIESALSRHETVEVVNAIGNHDEVLSMALSIMLANIYENEPRVVVHDKPTWRHYVKHGKTLIGIVHGDKTKDRDLPGIMAAERPEDWGQTRHRYFYRGHHHHDSKDEFNGCVVEQFRTLAAADAYAVSHGWMSGRDMKLIVHHSEYGEVARTTCSIDLLRDLRA